MEEAWAHMTLISTALSHQNHINYFRAFFLDEQRARTKSKSLLLSRLLNLLPRFAARWAVPSCRFWHDQGLLVKFHTTFQHGKYLTCFASPKLLAENFVSPPLSTDKCKLSGFRYFIPFKNKTLLFVAHK